MSKYVAFAAIQGGYNIVSKVKGQYQQALETFQASTEVGFPNTAYYLPIIYSLTGHKVKTLEDMKTPLEYAKKLLPPHVKRKNHLPFLGPLLNAGMAAVFACEIQEALNYLYYPDFYLASAEEIDKENNKIWMGAADDEILKKGGDAFVNGAISGFAVIVGAAPNPETAKMIVEDYQKKGIYCLLAANQKGTTCAQQLRQAGVEIGWNTGIVPFGPEISAAVFALGFCNRAAMALGGIQPGDFKNILLYNKDHVPAFINALGDVNAEWAAAAAGAVNWGFPIIADTDIPEILPTGICTYEHIVSNVPHEKMVPQSIETRGVKVAGQEAVRSTNQEKEEKAAKEDKAAQEKASKKEKEEDYFTQMARIQKEEAAKLEAEEEKLRQERKQERDKQVERKMQEMEEKIQRKNNPASEQKTDLEKLIDRDYQFYRWTQ